ncbi:MAG TPA: hypothetical protein VGG71_14490, partial [Chitinophagaceae bacterium]
MNAHIFILSFILLSNSITKTDLTVRHKINQNTSPFIFDIQHGGDPYDKYDLKGPVEYDNFIKAFDSFQWLKEIDKANANPNGCSPTLSIKYKKSLKTLWVSMSGDRNDNGYLVGYVHNKYINGKTLKWLEIYLPNDKIKVKHLFNLFFDKE